MEHRDWRRVRGVQEVVRRGARGRYRLEDRLSQRLVLAYDAGVVAVLAARAVGAGAGLGGGGVGGAEEEEKESREERRHVGEDESAG